MNQKNKFCIGNWKMYINKNSDIINFINYFETKPINKHTELVLCPTFADLSFVDNLLDDRIKLGSQDISKFENGAFTGDVSIQIIQKYNCKYSIIGHSERRLNYNETDKDINLKLQLLNKSKINPIICVGETLQENEDGLTFEIIEFQINNIFKNIDILKNKKYLIAYEPRWAIGTGKAADIDTINAVCNHMKNIIKTIDKKYRNLYLLYGGSVNENNASEILNIDEIDGFLIGSASVDPDKLYKIYNKF